MKNQSGSTFKTSLNQLEHNLDIYALSYASFPAQKLYDDEALESLKSLLDKCHIYLIGKQPRIVTQPKAIENNNFVVTVERDDFPNVKEILFPVPEGFKFETNSDGLSYAINSQGHMLAPTEEQVLLAIVNQLGPIPFEVLYIGQAYGSDGERNVIDRLKKHETLQKISLQEQTEDAQLQIITLELSENRINSVINPFAKSKGDDQFKARLKMGLDKLENTSEAERVTLFEAAFIRYFQPEYNVRLKYSFPSTNLKMLQDCYDKDFQSLVAEICFDDFHYSLRSKTIAPTSANDHFAKYDLHTAQNRKSFFSTE